MKDQPHLRIDPDLLFDATLTDADLRVYLYLLWKIGRNHTCWPTQETIGNDLNRSAKSVARSIERLREAKKITTKRIGWGVKSLLHYALPEQTDLSTLPPTEQTDLSTLDALERTNLSAPERTNLGYITSTSTEELKNNTLGVLRVPTNLIESANGHPKKIQPTQELRAPTRRESTKPTNPNPNGWMSRPHAEQIRALLTHFNNTLPGKPLEAVEASQAAAAAFDTLLRQFKTPDEGLERLSAIITWVATCKQSRFWVGRVTTPRCLLPVKDGQPLWKRAEVEMLADREYQAEHEEDDPSIPSVREMRIKHGLSPV